MTETEGGDKLKSIRTLQTDVQELSKKGISFADIATESEKRGGLAAEEVSKFSLKKLSVIFITIVVIIGVGFGSFWLFNRRQQEKQAVSLLPKPILVSDQQVEAVADLNSIQSALKTPIRINNLLYISMTVKSEEFFKIIKANPPLELINSLDGRFMLSKFYLSKEWPILIFKIRSYESAFAGMIKWEKTISSDLTDIFSPSKPGDFQDKVIQNHDARVLNDENGNSVLIYSFINQNYLVIAQNEEPLKEIFRRFSLPQYLNE
jgi:hypothetical protein